VEYLYCAAAIQYEGGGYGVALSEALATALQMLSGRPSIGDTAGQHCIILW
jgi:hypothetical protein